MNKKLYKIKSIIVNGAQLAYINSELVGQSESNKEFFKHLLASTLVQAKYEGWIPIPHDFILKKFGRKMKWRELKQASLIDATEEYSRIHHNCRRFYIPDHIVHKFLDLGEKNVEGSIKYNLINGRLVTPKIKEKVRTTDETGSKLPPIIIQVKERLKRGVIHPESIKAHLDQLKAEMNKYPDGSPEYKTASGRLKNDKYIFQKIDNLPKEPSSWEGVEYFYQEWTVQRSGRISGGLQNASKQMKMINYRAPYEDNPFKEPGQTYIADLINYDLTQCHPNLIRASIEDAMNGIYNTRMTKKHIEGFNFLVTLTEDPNYRKKIADELGYSKDLIKYFINSILYGSNPESEKSDVRIELTQKYSEESADKMIRDVMPTLTPLLKLIRSWHDYLLRLAKSKRITPFTVNRDAYGRSTVINACGMPFRLKDFKPEERGRKLAAHFIQGLEACLMHYLTIKGDFVEVLSNEHDGLIVIEKSTLDRFIEFEENTLMKVDFMMTKHEGALYGWEEIIDKAFVESFKINNPKASKGDLETIRSMPNPFRYMELRDKNFRSHTEEEKQAIMSFNEQFVEDAVYEEMNHKYGDAMYDFPEEEYDRIRDEESKTYRENVYKSL